MRGTTTLALLTVVVALVCPARGLAADQFESARAEVSANPKSASAPMLPFSLFLDSHDTQVCENPNPIFSSTVHSNAQVDAVGSERMLQLAMLTSSYYESFGLVVCTPSGGAFGEFTVTASGPVFEAAATGASYSETQFPVVAPGRPLRLVSSLPVPTTPSFSPINAESAVAWSVGSPPGSPAAPYLPFSVSGATQRYNEPTPGDGFQDGGLRFQGPTFSSEMIGGFDLTDADQNPFTAFRFPDVPAGADNHFTLTFGATEFAGLAGETVDLRQYAPNGISALNLRGNLMPFLQAAAPDAAMPIGGPPPQLTFGLAFAQPGIGSFTLRPVPEPPTVVLALAGLALVLLTQRRRLGRPRPYAPRPAS